MYIKDFYSNNSRDEYYAASCLNQDSRDVEYNLQNLCWQWIEEWTSAFGTYQHNSLNIIDKVSLGINVDAATTTTTSWIAGCCSGWRW